MKAILVAFLLAQSPAVPTIPAWAMALDWKGWVVLEFKPDEITFYRLPILRMATPGVRRMWTRNEFLAPQDDTLSAVDFVEFDCNGRRVHVLQEQDYAGHDQTKSLDQGGETPWRYIVPGSVSEALLNVACAS